jgi:hypothetical protein
MPFENHSYLHRRPLLPTSKIIVINIEDQFYQHQRSLLPTPKLITTNVEDHLIHIIVTNGAQP